MRMVASLPLQFNEVLSICMTATSNIKFINWRPGTNELLPQNYRTPGDTISSVHNGGHVYKLISTSNFQDTCNMKLSGQQSHSVYSVWDVAWFSFTIYQPQITHNYCNGHTVCLVEMVCQLMCKTNHAVCKIES